MIKFVILLIVCLTLCNGLQKEREKGRQMAMILLKDCQIKETGTQDDMDTLAREEIPTTSSGQCMLACVYEKLDIYKDGNFNRENFLEMARIFTDNNKKMMKYVEQFADQCGGVEGDRCQKSAMFTKCVHDGITAVMHEEFDIV